MAYQKHLKKHNYPCQLQTSSLLQSQLTALAECAAGRMLTASQHQELLQYRDELLQQAVPFHSAAKLLLLKKHTLLRTGWQSVLTIDSTCSLGHIKRLSDLVKEH